MPQIQIAPPGLLVADKPSNRHYQASTNSSAEIMRRIILLTGLPTGRLGRIVGMQNYSQAYRWTGKGVGARRLSSLVLERLAWLLCAKFVYGVDLAVLKSVDWETGVATFYGDDEPKEQSPSEVHWRFKGR